MADASKSVAPHVEAALQYARDIAAGRIKACQWVRLAARRHLADLKRAKKDKGWGFYFEPSAAEKACRFVELMPLTKGRWAARGERFILQPWQSFITVVIFGWLRHVDGKRRFRRVFLLIPRKNGKSEWAAAIGNYLLFGDGEFGAEVYSGATTEKQAWFIFGAARQMALRSPKLLSRFGGEVFASNIHINGKNARFEPIIGKPGDGANPHGAFVDEYHEHETDEQVDAMQTGMGAREQPLLVITTTAGDNIAGPCYQAELEARKVLSGVMDNDELFACIWGIDPGDDWTKDAALVKANPNLNVSVFMDFLKARRDEALQQPRKAGSFKTKHLNVWVSARNAFFPLQRFLESADDGLRMADLVGRRCWAGLDLASKVDIASLVLLFQLDEDREKPRFAAFCFNYLPSETVDKSENEAYQGWALSTGHNGGPRLADAPDSNPDLALIKRDVERDEDGAPVWTEQPRLRVTDGAIIDFDEIHADIVALSKVFQLESVAYDPHQATQLVTQLMSDGVPVLEFRPTVLNFSEPMKEIEGLMLERRIVYDGDPVFAWAISNVVAREDAKENVYPRKDAPGNKIDPAVALISAFGAMKLAPQPNESVYATRGLVEIGV